MQVTGDGIPARSASSVIQRFFSSVIRHRLLVIVMVVATAVAGALSARGIAVDNSLSSHFIEGDPAYDAYRGFCSNFDSGETIFVAVHLPKHLDRREYTLVFELTETLAKRVPNIRSPDRNVVSISQAPFFKNVDGELVTSSLDRPDTLDAARFDSLKKSIAAYPLYRGLLISDDSSYAVLAIAIRPPSDKAALGSWQEESTDAVFKVLEEQRFSTLEAHVVGLPVLSTVYGKMTRQETGRGAILAAILICALLFFCHRNARGVLLPLTVVFSSLTIVFGLLASFSKLSITTTILPPLMLAIGVCASNHVISAFDARTRTEPTRKAALICALSETFFPALLAAATSAIGFLSFAVVPIAAVRDTGILSAAGTIIAFTLSFTLLPALLSFSKRRRPRSVREPADPRALDRALLAVSRPAISRPFVVIAIAMALTAIAVFGVSRIRTETDWLSKFDEDARIIRDYSIFDSKLGGTQSLEVVLLSEDPVSMSDLESLRQIDDFASRIAALPGVRRVISPINIVKQANMTLEGDAPEGYRLPATQLHLDDIVMVGGSADAARTFKYVSEDRRRIRLTVRTINLSDQQLAAVIEGIEQEGTRHLSGAFEVSTTGAAVLALKTFGYIEHNQRLGLIIAFVVISLLLMLAMRSPSMGLVAMIPNLIPIAWTAGVMGFLDVPLDTAVMLVASIAIGVAVDDTIHLTHRVRAEILADGSIYPDAIARSIRGVGRPILFTSLVLGAGFLSLAVSDMKNISRFGVLSGLTVIFAWIADMLVLPALLVIARPFRSKFRARKTTRRSGDL